jgi:multimeric flavodoxin WrbA
MNEIYPRWVAAHVFIISPVNWYPVPASLKLIDRLVCADGAIRSATTNRKDP